MDPFTFRKHVLFVILFCGAIGLHFVLNIFNLSTFFGIQASQIPLLVVLVIGIIPLLMEIGGEILKGNFGVDLLAAISLVTAIILGEYLAGVLIMIMLSGGQALENYAMRRASSVLRALADRMPAVAHVQKNQHTEDIPVGDIQIGDIIVVFPHEACPVDGVVIEGHGAMDEAYLTGEPYLVSKVKGTSVISGAINGETVLVIQADKRASDSRYAKICEVMQEAEQKRPQLRRLADQLGTFFTPLALLIAGITWMMTGEAMRFLAVIIIATPCPLLIAIPVTLISAISMAARLKIIIKDPRVLERLPTCRTAIFDKTGTLTYGKPVLTDIQVGQAITRELILQYAATLEQYSKHPLAQAILDAAEAMHIVLLEAEQVAEKPGQGLTGIVAGHEIRVTHRPKVPPELFHLLPPVRPGLECIVLIDGQYGATFWFHDAPRLDGKTFIDHLIPIHHFSKVMLVSGDRESEVRYFAEQMGIGEMYASQTPEQKLELVRQETLKAPTLFIGDGINDSPALTAATVGLAFGKTNSVTIEAAGAVIMESTLSKVDELLHLSLNMRRIALQSAIGGMLLSLLGMGFAALGFMTPVMGALTQECIDVVAIVWALRLTWQKIETDL